MEVEYFKSSSWLLIEIHTSEREVEVINMPSENWLGNWQGGIALAAGAH